ncbi:MAG TPA: class I SAM-dependent methyltransferase [Anaerovoracaceae bacterium]|nr:class I SAM-dependent methyltransferase [Anaerovoracaceae bacterium]
MDKTLEYYNNAAKEYVNETVDANVSELNNLFLKYLPDKANILDLGCGSGRDSKVFIDRGHNVTAIDGSFEFCKLASEYLGQAVICMKFDELDYVGKFDGVWACASILHVPVKDLEIIFKKISRALKDGGYFFTCFKYGEFEGERNGRYFTDLTENRLKSLVANVKELKIIETTITGDVRAGRENEKWLNIIMEKSL